MGGGLTARIAGSHASCGALHGGFATGCREPLTADQGHPTMKALKIALITLAVLILTPAGAAGSAEHLLQLAVRKPSRRKRNRKRSQRSRHCRRARATASVARRTAPRPGTSATRNTGRSSPNGSRRANARPAPTTPFRRSDLHSPTPTLPRTVGGSRPTPCEPLLQRATRKRCWKSTNGIARSSRAISTGSRSSRRRKPASRCARPPKPGCRRRCSAMRSTWIRASSSSAMSTRPRAGWRRRTSSRRRIRRRRTSWFRRPAC